jgi:guanylate kinase
MSHWNEFDYVIINDDLDQATAELVAIIEGRGEASAAGNPALVSRIENMLV